MGYCVHRRRSDALAKGNAFRAEGKGAQARECYVKAVDVTPAMAYQLIKVRGEGAWRSRTGYTIYPAVFLSAVHA